MSSLNVRCWVVLAVILLGLPLAALATPQVGAPAPDFTGTDSQSNTHRLSDYRGKIVVLEWTNHECPFVGKHYGTANMQKLQQEAAEQDIVWLSIISSAPGKQGHVTPAEANELTTSRNAAPSAVLLDPEGIIGQAYGAKTTPHMYIIDPEGKLVYMGGIDDIPSARWSDVETAQNYVRAALTALAEDKPVDPAVTRPYGCTVKY
jgi:peroxiredoxin